MSVSIPKTWEYQYMAKSVSSIIIKSILIRLWKRNFLRRPFFFSHNWADVVRYVKTIATINHKKCFDQTVSSGVTMTSTILKETCDKQAKKKTQKEVKIVFTTYSSASVFFFFFFFFCLFACLFVFFQASPRDEMIWKIEDDWIEWYNDDI